MRTSSWLVGLMSLRALRADVDVFIQGGDESRVRLTIDLSDLKRSQTGSIIGRIWFAAGNAGFPTPRWSDFVVVLLGWWIRELLRLRGGWTQAELLFMDGPYSVGLDASQDRWAFSFLRDEAADESMPRTVSAHGGDFETNIVAVVREVIAACRRHGWSDDPEVQQLVRLSDELGRASRLR